MVEVLVGLLIITFGLLGLMSMQARALQASVGTEDAQRAVLLANEMAVAMFNANTVDVGRDAVKAWRARVADASQRGVPNGVGAVTMTSPTTARITVSWTPVQSRGTADAAHRYSTDVLIP
jgi:type IV pilus assembly protein PilV